MKLTELASAIHEGTGYTGELLTQATFVAAALFADLHGRKDIGDYFVARAEGIDAPKPPARMASDNAPFPGWNFGAATEGCIE